MTKPTWALREHRGPRPQRASKFAGRYGNIMLQPLQLALLVCCLRLDVASSSLLPAQAATPAAPPAIRVACVGDSITAGYLSSNASFAYPGRLPAQLDAKFGPDAYEVTNFGAGGATVQKGADSPYWNRTQYAALVNAAAATTSLSWCLVQTTRRIWAMAVRPTGQRRAGASNCMLLLLYRI